MTSGLRDILERLSEGMFHLNEWIQTKSYNPEDHGEAAPWRHPVDLTPKKLGAIEFFDAMLRETAGDAVLLRRWSEVSLNPLRFSAQDEPQTWRTDRGLCPAAKFGPDISQNSPYGRAGFYGPFWPLLQQAVAAANPQDVAAWQALADELLADKPGHWPQGGPKSSDFIKQFAADVLYAMMDMRNPVAEPVRSALLAELGEHRRVGNKYTAELVESARQALQSAIDGHTVST